MDLQQPDQRGGAAVAQELRGTASPPVRLLLTVMRSRAFAPRVWPSGSQRHSSPWQIVVAVGTGAASLPLASLIAAPSGIEY